MKPAMPIKNFLHSRKLATWLSVIVIIALIAIGVVMVGLGDKSPISPTITTALVTFLGLLLPLLQVFFAWRSWIHESKKLTDQEIENAFTSLAQAETFLKQKDYRRAIEQASQVIGKLPKKANAYRVRAQAHFALGQVASAINDYDKAVELEPGYPFIYSFRASVYQSTGEYDKAIKDLEMSLILAPEVTGAIFQLGDAYFLIGKYKEAAAMFQKVLDTPKTTPGEKNMAKEYIGRLNNLQAAQLM